MGDELAWTALRCVCKVLSTSRSKATSSEQRDLVARTNAQQCNNNIQNADNVPKSQKQTQRRELIKINLEK